MVLKIAHRREEKSGSGSGCVTEQVVQGGPGSVSPGPSASVGVAERTMTSATARETLRNISTAPVIEDRRDAGRATADSTTLYRRALSPEREEFGRLFNANLLPEAQELARRMFDTGIEHVAWVNNLANVRREQKNLSAAYDLYLTHAHLLDNAPPLDAAKYSLTFGWTSLEYGDRKGKAEYYDRALFYFEKAAGLYESTGLPLKRAACRYNAGLALVALRRFGEALACFDGAEEMYREAGDVVRAAMCDVGRSRAYAAKAVAALAEFKDSERAAFVEACETQDRVFEKVKA